jgi:hypothetical protein
MSDQPPLSYEYHVILGRPGRGEVLLLPGVRERLRDAYLEPWSARMPRGRLERAFELAQPLAALHHAITYQQVVLPGMEVAWEMELMLPFYLKMLLRLAA